MHQAVWKSTVAIFEPTVRITRQPSDQTPNNTKKPPTAMIQTCVEISHAIEQMVDSLLCC